MIPGTASAALAHFQSQIIRMSLMSRIIFHIDLDAFFAAVEQRDDPSLRGCPVIIGADPREGKGRGVVCTCSYEARRFGIHSAMPIGQAWHRCPQGAFLRPRMEVYEEASRDVFQIFQEFSPEIEPLSIDEAFLDMTGSAHLFGTALEAGQRLRRRVREQTGLSASLGIAPNKMTAKIASDECKPDGILEIRPEGVLSFLHPLPVEKLWGVGPRTRRTFEELGIMTIGDLARFAPQNLPRTLGVHGMSLAALANGIDDRPVLADDEVKSVSHEQTFDTDTEDQRLIFDALLALSEKVSDRLRAVHLKGRLITLKVRLSGFETFSHSIRLDERTNHADKIFKRAREMFIDHFVHEGPVRLIGVKVSNFDDGYVQESLFADDCALRNEAVHQAVDEIREKFGRGAIRRAGG